MPVWENCLWFPVLKLEKKLQVMSWTGRRWVGNESVNSMEIFKFWRDSGYWGCSGLYMAHFRGVQRRWLKSSDIKCCIFPVWLPSIMKTRSPNTMASQYFQCCLPSITPDSTMVTRWVTHVLVRIHYVYLFPVENLLNVAPEVIFAWL